MCTVTYIPYKRGCFLTSSRDESVLRPNALPPDMHQYNGTGVVYPRDAKANGSWIAFTQHGNSAVLLNGGFEKHIPTPPYRKSRGLVFLDIISHPQPEFCFLGMSLEQIEPFTLVLFAGGFLFEARWDGQQKHFLQLDEKATYIWSSVTLYAPAVIDKRKQWFENWLAQNTAPSAAAVFDFHRFAGEGDSANSVLMNRDNELLTISITGIDICMDAATMQHFDLKENKHFLKSVRLQTVVA